MDYAPKTQHMVVTPAGSTTIYCGLRLSTTYTGQHGFSGRKLSFARSLGSFSTGGGKVLSLPDNDSTPRTGASTRLNRGIFDGRFFVKVI